MRRGRPHNGFSLVELIVVIGVIGVLIAMLLPALRVVRENAQRIKCQANLRQIGFALQMYANSNKGWLPSWSGWHSTAFPADSSQEPSWCGKLADWLSPDSAVYQCPSFPQDPMKLHNYFIEAVWANANGMHATKLSDIRHSSEFLLSGDMTQPALYPAPLGTSSTQTDDYDRDDAGMACLCFADDGGFLMHRGGNNVLFTDLHVDTFAEFDPARITFHPTRMLSWSGVTAAGADQSGAQ
ncbi:MAG TPA: type II secretion system protein [Tepidisphaeraceae bacterium]